MIRRIVVVIAAVLAALMGLLISQQVAAVAASHSEHAYTYDGHRHDALHTDIAPERGPPVDGDTGPTADCSVDHWSHGDLARPVGSGSRVDTTSDDRAGHVQDAQAAARTWEPARPSEGDLSSLTGGCVAAETATGAARIPFGPGTEKAWSVLERVNAKGSPLPGYKGGSVFKNAEGRLPGADGAGKPISYRDWDVNPYTKGVDRGAERVVTGSDGSAYYTGDHYGSFLQFWGPGG